MIAGIALNDLTLFNGEIAMPYLRVLPRDLFNESKLLKCLGQLSLMIRDGQCPAYLEHDDSENPGFTIDQYDSDGGLFVVNLRLHRSVDHHLIFLSLRYNSKDPCPLVFFSRLAGDELRVFNDDGTMTKEFLYYVSNKC